MSKTRRMEEARRVIEELEARAGSTEDCVRAPQGH